MGAKWSTVSMPTYAANSPSDDGAATAGNIIKYATILTDLTNPLEGGITSVIDKLDELFTEATTPISTSRATVASDHATILETTNGIISLLAAATAGAGYRVGVYASGANITVQRSSTDTINGATSVIVPDKGLMWFTVNAAGDGYLVTGDNPGMHKIARGTLSSAATLDITGLSDVYAAYLLVFDDLVPATDNVGFWLRTDSDAGASFDAGASDYAYAWHNVTEAGASAGSGSSGDTKIAFFGNAGTGAAEQISGRIMLFNPMKGGQRPKIAWEIAYRDKDNVFRWNAGAGERNSAAATIDAIRLLFSSGNIATMNYTLYGLRA